MTGKALSAVVQQTLAYRGWKSPEAIDQSYRPERAPVGGATIRRIIDQTWERGDDLTLLRLDGMLKLPPRTLLLVQAGDAEGIRRLEFVADDGPVRQLILDLMQPPQAKTAANKPARRRSGS